MTDSIVLGTPTSHEWISSIAMFTAPNTATTTASFSSSGIVILKTTNSSSTFYDTIHITLNPLPEITIQQLVNSPVCEGGDNEALLAIPSGGAWTSQDPPAIVGGNQFSPGNATIHSSFFQLY